MAELTNPTQPPTGTEAQIAAEIIPNGEGQAAHAVGNGMRQRNKAWQI